MSALMLLFILLPISCTRESRDQLRNSIDQRLQSVLSLHTAEYLYNDVIYYGDQTSFLGIPTGARQILFSVDVRIRAGINIQEGLQVAVNQMGEVEIVLPEARILYADVEEKTIHQYFVRQYGRQISWIDIQDVVAAAKDQLIVDAVKRGILQQADRQAESIVRNLLEGSGVRNFQIIRRERNG